MRRPVQSNGSALSRVESVRVWDAGVRAAHWILVAGVVAAALTGFIIGPTSLTWHLIAGATVMAVVVWRTCWACSVRPTLASAALPTDRTPCSRICTISAATAGTIVTSGTIPSAP
jgi:cytochrome b561